MLYMINNKEYTEKQLRNKYKNSHSLHNPISSDNLKTLNAIEVVETTKPTHSDIEDVERDGLDIIDGVYYTKWKIVKRFTQEEEVEYLDNKLLELKKEKIKEAKFYRENVSMAILSNFQVATLIDRENIQGSINYFDVLAQGGTTIVWTMADNTEKTVTKQELQDVLDAYVVRKAQAFAEYQSKKTQIEACTTIEELEALGY